MISSTVAAVVVTYNRINLLKRTIASLNTQQHALSSIIVINNSSTDGTKEWLKEQPELIVLELENRGGAFGFYTGIKEAYSRGFEWIWCMDDDGYPDKFALQELFRYKHHSPCVMNSLVLDEDNHDLMSFKIGNYTHRRDIVESELINGEANFFNGTFLHYEIIKDVGFPLSDLVIWGDESEYFNRIKYAYKFPLFTVISSLHYHPSAGKNFYLKNWDVKIDWRPYFFVRNKIFVYSSRYKYQFFIYGYYLLFLIVFLGTIILFQRQQHAIKLKLFFIAAIDGLKKNTSKSILDIKNLSS